MQGYEEAKPREKEKNVAFPLLSHNEEREASLSCILS
jgi:hypothetical protein